jgi:hypothetical protein
LLASELAAALYKPADDVIQFEAHINADEFDVRLRGRWRSLLGLVD